MNVSYSIRSSVLYDPMLGSATPRMDFLWFLALLVWSVSLSGCSLTYESTKTPRSPIEQLLLTQSLQRSLTDAVSPIPPGQSVAVETIGLTADQAVVTAWIEKWLSREGLNLPKDGKESLIARVRLEAFGTLQDSTFFGIPQISGGLLPLAFPELAFYKAQRQRGLARLSIDFIERSTGQLMRSTPVYEGDAFYHQFTLLLIVNYRDTDLLPPPP